MDEMTGARADELLRGPAADRAGMTEAEIMDLWIAWLYETHGEGLPRAVLDAVWGQAWTDGHSSGLESVQERFLTLVELAEKVIAAVR